jgi:hypothetical protein
MIRKTLLLLVGAAAFAVAGCSSAGSGTGGGTASQSAFLHTDAEYAVVDFFDMYCRTCQSSAGHVNDLHALVKRRGLESKIAFYAVGWGNTAMESELYRTRYHVPYPVIPDPDRAISRRYGEFRPPLLLVLHREGANWKEVYRNKDLTVPAEHLLPAFWHGTPRTSP